MTAPPDASLARRSLIAATALAALGLAASYLLAWLPVWPCSLLEHFRVQYVATGAVVVAAAAILRIRGWLDVAAIATLLHALPVTADLCRPGHAGPADGVALRVLLLNVHTESSGFAEVRRLIADEQPDVVALVEVDQRWIAGVAPAVAGYPGRILGPRGDNFGVALYARGALTGAAVELGGSRPSIIADLAIRSAVLHIVLVHPVPPITRDAAALQRRQIDAIAARAPSALPTILLGDFNATPWSRPFVALERRTGLCDSRAGFGIQASYPAESAVLRIPIDHLLASCAIGVRDRRIGRDVGSDHLPVILDLVVPAHPASAHRLTGESSR